MKHDDLSSALVSPDKSVDVQMAADGLNFTCETCHASDKHVFAGSRYNVTASDDGGTGLPGMRRDVATCESCHSDRPHPATLLGIALNDHADRVACQTCHIPEFARGGVATKTFWDWSAAGKLKDGKPYAEEGFTQSDGKHLHTSLSTKGNFKWGENVVAYYAWFNGQVDDTTADQTIDPSKRVEINRLSGSGGDPHSRIWPFKRMDGRQAYLVLKLVLFPAIWITGLAYLSDNFWEAQPGASVLLEVVANLYILSAFAAFVVVHVYLLTAGHSFCKHLRPMITGFDRIDLSPEEEACLARDEPGRLKE